jgi:hypothetical protein
VGEPPPEVPRPPAAGLAAPTTSLPASAPDPARGQQARADDRARLERLDRAPLQCREAAGGNLALPRSSGRAAGGARLAAAALPLSCCAAGVQSAFTTLSISTAEKSFREPLEPGTAFAPCWTEPVRVMDVLYIWREEKLCAPIRPLALRLPYIPDNPCVAGERRPPEGGHSLLSLFQGTSRALGGHAAVLPGEEDDDVAPRSGSRALP